MSKLDCLNPPNLCLLSSYLGWQCLKKGAEGRKYSICLQSLEYSGDLANQLMSFSNKMETVYRHLSDLCSRKGDRQEGIRETLCDRGWKACLVFQGGGAPPIFTTWWANCFNSEPVHLPTWEILLSIFHFKERNRNLDELIRWDAPMNKLSTYDFWPSQFTLPPNHLLMSLSSLRPKPWQTGLEQSRRKERVRRTRERRLQKRKSPKPDLGHAICSFKFCRSSASRVRSQRVAGQKWSDSKKKGWQSSSAYFVKKKNWPSGCLTRRLIIRVLAFAVIGWFLAWRESNSAEPGHCA